VNQPNTQKVDDEKNEKKKGGGGVVAQKKNITNQLWEKGEERGRPAL